MKKTAIILGILISAVQVFSQAPVDKLKKEVQALKNQVATLKVENDTLQKQRTALVQDTTFLRKQVEMCSLYGQNKFELISSLNNFKIKVLSCNGDRKSQRIYITLLIENLMANQTFFPVYGKNIMAVDSQGNTFTANPSPFEILTNAPTKLVYYFESVLPSTDMLKVVSMQCMTKGVDYKENNGSIGLRNLKVTWN